MCVFVSLTGSEDCGNRRDSEATDRCDLSAVKYRIIITGILSYSLILASKVSLFDMDGIFLFHKSFFIEGKIGFLLLKNVFTLRFFY